MEKMVGILFDAITAFGTVIAAISVVAVFVLYRIQKTDEDIARMKQSIQILYNQADSIKLQCNMELFSELVNTAVYSDIMTNRVKNLFAYINRCRKEEIGHDEACTNIQEMLSIWIIPFQGPLSVQYEETVEEIRENALVFYPSYVGLYRFARASARLFRNIIITYKTIVLDERIIAENVFSIFILGKEGELGDFEDFRDELRDMILGLLDIQRQWCSQDDMDEMLAIINIVYESHIKSSKKEWKQMKRDSRKIKMKSSNEIDTIPEEILETKRCFERIMSKDDQNLFTSFAESILDRNNKWDEDELNQRFISSFDYPHEQNAGENIKYEIG